MYRLLDVLLGRPHGKQSKTDSQGKKIVHRFFKLAFPSPFLPFCSHNPNPEKKRAAMGCSTVSQSYFVVPTKIWTPASISFQQACPLSVQTGFLTSCYLAFALGNSVPEACEDSHKCSALPQPCLVAKGISSRGHQGISLTAKIAGMRSYAWQLHWLLERGAFFLGYLGTSTCCLLLLLPANSFNSFQHPLSRTFVLSDTVLNLAFHTLGVIFFNWIS